MMVWLSKQPSWGKRTSSFLPRVHQILLSVIIRTLILTSVINRLGNARDVAISTESYGNTSTAVLVDKEDESESRIYKSSKKLTYYPSLSKTYSMWYKGRYMTITRTQENTGWYGHKERTLHIRYDFHSSLLGAYSIWALATAISAVSAPALTLAPRCVSSRRNCY
jgi:hypothetical protein